MLTRDQIIQNINAMEAQGAPQQDIQEYLDSLQGQVAPSEPQAQSPTLAQELKNSFQKRGGQLRGALEKEYAVAAKKGSNVPSPAIALNIAGAGAGVVNDTLSSLLRRGASAVGKGISAITPDFIEEPVKETVKEGAQAIGRTEIVQEGLRKLEMGGKAYDLWKRDNPRIAQAVEDVANIADAVGTERLVESAGNAVEKGVRNAASKTAQFSKTIAKQGKDLAIQGKDRLQEAITPLDKVTENTLDPVRRIPGDVASKLDPETIKNLQAGKRAKLDFYLNKARRAVTNPAAPTPLEVVGEKAEGVVGKLNVKLSNAGKIKSAETVKLGANKLSGVEEIRAKMAQALAERAGVELSDDGVTAIMGRTGTISDPSDIKILKLVDSKIAELGPNPTFRQVDDTVDYLQDILYKTSGPKVAVPVNTKVEAIVKQTARDLNSLLRQNGTTAYVKANQRYSAYIELRNRLNKMLGEEGIRGGSVMKRVFSPADGGTKKLFSAIKKATGVDLIEDSALAKFAMEHAGDARQSSLLEQLELIKGAVGARGSFVERGVETLLKKVQDPVEKARKIAH